MTLRSSRPDHPHLMLSAPDRGVPTHRKATEAAVLPFSSARSVMSKRRRTSSRRRFGVSSPRYDRPVTRPFVSLLTDFGLRDMSAAIVRGVVLGIAPDAEVLDITHEVRKYRIRDGALMLWCALPYLPVGIHVAVVDPGVGTARRPLAIRTGRGDTLIGPDNGLLLPAAGRLGGVAAARELAEPAYRLPVITATFHGRDIFAPAAAHLANGVALEALGPAVDPATLVPSPLPEARVAPGRLDAEAVYVDTFGNVKTSALMADLGAALGALAPGAGLRVAMGDGRELALPWSPVFWHVPPGSPMIYADAYDRVCIAVNQGNAAASLGLEEDLSISIRRG